MALYTFTGDEDDLRIDLFLSEQLRDVSRSYIQKLIKDGKVLLNDEVVLKKNTQVTEDDRVTIEVPPPKVLDVVPEDLPLEIVYEDLDVIVVNKPQGMVVHPAPGHERGTLVNALMYHADSLSGINGVIRPGIVHRIDKDTAGLLMVAKNDQAHRSLAAQLKEHSTLREYLAICHGRFKSPSGTIDLPVGRNPHNRLKMAVVANGKRAITHYEVVEQYTQFALIRCRLETGRTHQIRVHMSHKHHPLLGDPIYGPASEKVKHDGQLLFAATLGFDHPSTGERMVFTAEPPDYFLEILEKVRAL